ncbi:transcriptional regulator, TetR family [Anaeromyxobacter dehalogenans 2CP-1]|uniref:Transcriptional regulator, TetR family n=1 Tax=Anaeromyxobacter dehalogenans (strain ATCC BAA-258 / DSM 21875 / 2CP-1) TaxID=455488 RepID=B8J8J7_ANAD2|nr:TetR/AcrR family transcriptional regulator [Anaeromyxobacter dehalogenans]ACL67283.1 transcriptional regulator, TetR family [Anaeromyxobacter dehalogenans 2CP-1]
MTATGRSAAAGGDARSGWCRAGLALLRDQGPQAVTIDRLCGAMGRTKGAFYHHFRDVDAFHAALLDAWTELHTGDVIAATSGPGTAEARSARLGAAAVGLDHALDRAVRGWALHDARAREALDRVDARRIDYLAAIHRERGRKDATVLAQLEYAVFLGAQELGLADDRERGVPLGRTLRTALEWLGGAGHAEGTRRQRPRSSRAPGRRRV